ncbi:MAG: RusA family crossover junction endodeoxyribonuclease [Thiobacillus sp.]
MNDLILPWPPSILSPNSRPHWAVKSIVAKKYRTDCGWLTKAAGINIEWDGIVHLWITFNPPSRRHYDDDNLVAAFKSGRDGIADAIGINDKRFRMHPWLSTDCVKGGTVCVRFTRGIEEAIYNQKYKEITK